MRIVSRELSRIELGWQICICQIEQCGQALRVSGRILYVTKVEITLDEQPGVANSQPSCAAIEYFEFTPTSKNGGSVGKGKGVIPFRDGHYHPREILVKTFQFL